MFVVGVDPSSLGVLEAPPRYGADAVCGELQPLGVHMHYGGGLAGFVATPDEERWVAEYPTFLVGITPPASRASTASARSCGSACRTSRAARPRSTRARRRTSGRSRSPSTCRCSGRRGSGSSAEGLMRRSRYAAQRLSELPGVTAPALSAPFFKELVVSFSAPASRCRDQRRPARTGDLRRQGHLRRVPGARPERALLRHRAPHEGRHRQARRRRSGRCSMRVTAATAFPPGELERADRARARHSGERGILLPELERDAAAAGDGLGPEELQPHHAARAAGALAAPGAAALSCASPRRRSESTSTSTSAWAPAR